MGRLPWRAQVYVWSIVGVSAMAVLWSLTTLQTPVDQWILLVIILAAAAAASSSLPSLAVLPDSSHAYTSCLLMAMLLLPPGALALLILLSCSSRWIRLRLEWYKHLFNACAYLTPWLCASLAYSTTRGSVFDPLNRPIDLLAATLAAMLSTVLNRFIVGTIFVLGGERPSLSATGLFTPISWFTSASWISTGLIAAYLWTVAPWMATLVVAPLLITGWLFGQLRNQTYTDAKTSLLNTSRFYEILRQALVTLPGSRPTAVIMADLDLLREINNTHGHLVGDVVIRGIADAIRVNLRKCDAAARFGGEEFAILLRDCGPDEAMAVAERIRTQVAGTRFATELAALQVRATLSLGIAIRRAGEKPEELLYRADQALYSAKLRGRNQTCLAEPDGGSDEKRALGNPAGVAHARS